MELRTYQRNLVNKARQAYANGYRAPCIVAPCGSGKSIMIAEIIKQTTDKHKTVLFLVHRAELLQQIENTLTHYGVNMKYVQLGMVMTVVRRLNMMTTPDLIVIDENHHVLANSYRKILDHFKTYVLGFTATPVRLNGDGLVDVNDILIEEVDAKYLINNHFLAPYEYFSVNMINSKALKKKSTGDYTGASMDDAFKNVFFGDVVKHYKELADGQQAILYAHSIEFSKLWVKEFVNAGINAKHVDGTTPKAEREQIMEDFRKGKITILSNVDLIGEGFDVPDCSCVILLRPTQSLSLFIQQSMRPMRYKPNKKAIIIDHVGNFIKHGLPDMKREWTLEKKKKRQREDVQGPPIIECEQCLGVFYKEDTVEDGIFTCPLCGHEEEVKKEKAKKVNDKSVKLEKITEDIYATINPNTAKSYKELLKIAKARGYKTSWASFKAKQLGLPDTPLWVYRYENKNTKFSKVKEIL